MAVFTRFRRLARVLALVVSLGAMALALGPAQAQDGFPQSNAWARITPSVVWCGDPTSTVKIEVHIVGRTDVAAVQLTNGGEANRITLYDDGTHGDAAAGDNVFTATGVQLACYPYMLTYDSSVGTWWGYIRVRLKNGQELGNNYGFAAGVVDPRFKNVFRVHNWGGGLSATAYAYFINDSLHQVLDNYPVANVRCGTSNFQAYQKLYQHLPDVFDVAVLMAGMQIFRPSDLAENVPYQVQVSNAVQRIGLPLMDNTDLFGSGGRLKSTVYLSFGSIQVFDHEIAHTWGAGIGATLGLIEEGMAGRYHWESMSDIGGQLGAYYRSDGLVGHFAHNGDDTWRLVHNTENELYSPLELYVMGLIPPEQVPPIHILTNPDLTNPARITAGSVQHVTIQQIMASMGGPRIPSAASSQKQFNLAFIVTQDGPYDDAAYAFFSLLAHAIGRRGGPSGRYDMYAPFHWATGGRGTLKTRLPVAVPDPFRAQVFLPMVRKP